MKKSGSDINRVAPITQINLHDGGKGAGCSGGMIHHLSGAYPQSRIGMRETKGVERVGAPTPPEGVIGLGKQRRGEMLLTVIGEREGFVWAEGD